MYAGYDSSRNYLAPYTTIVGPSGIGKSFAVKELAFAHNLYVVYLNLSETSRGYPGQTPLRPVIAIYGNQKVHRSSSLPKKIL